MHNLPSQKMYWQFQRGDNWKARMCATFAGFLIIGLIISGLWIYFITYSRSRLTPYRERRCEKCNESPIPRIIHNTWIDEHVPEKWHTTWHACLAAHKDHERMFWTHADMEAFIDSEYPWFLATFKAYPHQIQRVDSFRYFALYHFGGIYTDLDVGCRVSVHEIMQNLSDYNVLLAEAMPSGVKTELMASVAKHPLFHLAISRLESEFSANWWFGLPYVEVMFSTGPMFLTSTVSIFDNNDVFILPYEEYKTHFWPTTGNSWHQWDAKFFVTLASTVPQLKLVALLLCITLLMCGVVCSHRYWCRKVVWVNVSLHTDG